MLKEYKFELSESIEYHDKQEHSADIANSTTIILYAPSRKNMKNNTLLKQYFFAAVNSNNSSESVQNDDKKQQEMTGELVMEMMYMASEIDMNAIIDAGCRLIVATQAKINGVTPLTSEKLDDINVDDITRMVGEYMVNFTIASTLLLMKDD